MYLLSLVCHSLRSSVCHVKCLSLLRNSNRIFSAYKAESNLVIIIPRTSMKLGSCLVLCLPLLVQRSFLHLLTLVLLSPHHLIITHFHPIQRSLNPTKAFLKAFHKAFLHFLPGKSIFIFLKFHLLFPGSFVFF